MLGTYQRLHVHVAASRREVIRAAARKLKPCARYGRRSRVARHAFYRAMLAHHERALRLYLFATGSV